MAAAVLPVDPSYTASVARLGTESPRVEPTELPTFLHTLITLASTARERVTCVVLPRVGDTAHALAALIALDRFRVRLPTLLAEYARTEFREGELVRVLPNGFVYEYAGFFDRDRFGSQFFKLRLVGTVDGEARSCPAADILRLQRTDSRKPRGRATSDLGRPVDTPLDRLLGVRTLGNTAILRNEVILQSNRTAFEAFLSNVSAQAPVGQAQVTGPVTVSLAGALPWGVVCEDGRLAMEEGRDGTPISAVSPYAHRIRTAADRLPVDSTLVLIDGARRVQDTELLLATADRQRVLVLAEQSEIEHVENLRRAGAVVWQPEAAEILGNSQPPFTSCGVGRELLRATQVSRELRLDTIAVPESSLDRAATHLRQAEESITDDVDAVAREAIGDCFGMLLDLADWYTPPDPDAVNGISDRLRATAERLELVAHYLPASVSAPLEHAIADMRSFVKLYRSSPTQKLDTLARLLTELERARMRSAVLVRSASRSHQLSAHIAARWPSVVVIAGRASPADANYDAIVLAGWPRTPLLDHVIGRQISPHIRLIGYEYECRWMQGYERRRAALSRNWHLAGEERTRLLGLPPSSIRTDDVAPLVPEKGIEELLSAMRLDSMRGTIRKGRGAATVPELDVREGRYVGFCGSRYAYLTATHGMPRINRLLGGDRVQRTAVEQVVVDEMQPGDHILFRDAGESDVISLVARQTLGERYLKARRLADSWRRPLLSVGPDPYSIYVRLRRHGLTQQAATVQAWLRDPSRIGPQNEEDLRIIADAARDTMLFRDSRSVYEAIREVRSAHTSAGARLTQLLIAELPAKLDDLRGEETRVDLAFGAVWIVQVEEVSPDVESRSYTEVNRLLRDERYI